MLRHELIDDGISKVEPSENREYFARKTYIEIKRTRQNRSGQVVIVRKAPELALNGDYLVQLRLSEADVVNLVRIAFNDDAFVAALSKRKRLRK